MDIEVNLPKSLKLFCQTCNKVFINLGLYIHHIYKWHECTLLRRNDTLITCEAFQSTYKKSDINETEVNQIYKCEVCRKKYKSEKQYNNHIASKKHKIIQKGHKITRKVARKNKTKNNRIQNIQNTIKNTDSAIESIDLNKGLDDFKNPNNNAFFYYNRSMMHDKQFYIPKQLVILDDKNYEFKLPSGKVIGHRALMHYKQNLKHKRCYRKEDKKMQMEAIQRKSRDVQYWEEIKKRYKTVHYTTAFKQNKLPNRTFGPNCSHRTLYTMYPRAPCRLAVLLEMRVLDNILLKENQINANISKYTINYPPYALVHAMKAALHEDI